jgi:hypothetical protein
MCVWCCGVARTVGDECFNAIRGQRTARESTWRSLEQKLPRLEAVANENKQLEKNMQTINGSYKHDNSIDVGQLEVPATEPKERHAPPAHVIIKGRVVTRVWANPNAWGEVTWNIDQRLISYAQSSRWLSRTMPADCIDDAMRGMFAAQQWIHRKTNKPSLAGLLPWNWF